MSLTCEWLFCALQSGIINTGRLEIMKQLFNLIESTIKYFATNWIAIAALAISYLNYRQNNSQIEIDSTGQSDWLLSLLLNSGESIVNENGLLHVNLRIINSSGSDISFFDLIVLSSNNKQLTYHCQKQHNVFTHLGERLIISGLKSDYDIIELNIPETNFGTLKSHSLTSFDIIVPADDIGSELFVFFKTTKKNWVFRKNKIGYVNSPYQSFSASYRVEESNKPNYKEILEVLRKQ